METDAKSNALVRLKEPKWEGSVKKAKSPLTKKPRADIDAAFPIVAIGASAGGLEVFTQLLKDVPPDTGMAFVLIQHLDPSHRSFLTEALRKTTKMPVQEIRDGTPVERNHVYVIPPSADVAIANGVLTLEARSKDRQKAHLPIDNFFCSLAKDRGSQVIGVVLSGNASDGTEGLRTIKDEGGVTLCQDPRTAKFSSMPESALAAGVVDFSVSITDLAAEIIRLGHHLYYGDRRMEPFSLPSEHNEFLKVLRLVKDSLGIDFGEYKHATTKRRLARRMALLRHEHIGDYLKRLREDPDEVRVLSEDILIHVTSFFRDLEAFDYLKKSIFPALMSRRKENTPIRIWVAGCSTGEEVYSLVITLLEFLGDNSNKFPIQIFGSDVSEKMIQKARTGFYADSLLREVSPDRLRRFFVRVEGGYRIAKLVRDLCVFVRHDLARDPPFSRLDLITCRNVLIYFDQPLQKRILSTFHYCLNQPGFLLLGRTESVSSYQHLFVAVDKANKIFSRTSTPSQLRFPLAKSETPKREVPPLSLIEKPSDMGKMIDSLLLAEYAPCGVLINDRMEVLHFRGRTAPFLEQASGPPETNLLKMVREGLFVELKMAIAKAKKDHTSVRKEGITIKANGTKRVCNLSVRFIPGLDSKENFFLVLFEEANIVSTLKTKKGAVRKISKKGLELESRHSHKLEKELEATKEYLQSLNQGHQKTNDALAAANEELISGNEELQSMNEELETAKEELQSTNEELHTVNDELQNRSLEVGEVNNDLVNLLNSVEIPIVILDIDRRIRRFTPHAKKIMNLLPTDIGRSIDDIQPNVIIENLDQQISDVMAEDIVKESEVQDRKGRWHRMQIRPYKTLDNKIDGVVLSLVDIHILKRTASNAEWARDYATSIVEAVQVPLVVLDQKIRVVSANKAFYSLFNVLDRETEGKSLYDLGIGQ